MGKYARAFVSDLTRIEASAFQRDAVISAGFECRRHWR